MAVRMVKLPLSATLFILETACLGTESTHLVCLTRDITLLFKERTASGTPIYHIMIKYNMLAHEQWDSLNNRDHQMHVHDENIIEARTALCALY